MKRIKKSLKNRKGFTMIEMIIVIALIAMAAGVMYGVLGNSYADASVKSTATKLGDDLRSINEAAQKYFVDKAGTESTGLSGSATQLVDAGYMSTVPVSPSGLSGNYTWDTTSYTGWRTSAADTVVKIDIGNAATACQKVNELFAGDASGATPPTAVRTTKDLQCFGAAGGPYTVVKTIYTH